MNKDQPKKTVAIPSDLYDFYEKRAERFGRSVETMVEAVLAGHQVQTLGGTSDEVVEEMNRRLKFTDAEHEAITLRIVKEARAYGSRPDVKLALKVTKSATCSPSKPASASS